MTDPMRMSAAARSILRLQCSALVWSSDRSKPLLDEVNVFGRDSTKESSGGEAGKITSLMAGHFNKSSGFGKNLSNPPVDHC